MPLAQLKPVLIDEELPAGGRPRFSEVEAIGAASPARLLQRQLELQVSRDETRWPLGRAMAFIVISSAALWMALLVAASQVMHAIA